MPGVRNNTDAHPESKSTQVWQSIQWDIVQVTEEPGIDLCYTQLTLVNSAEQGMVPNVHNQEPTNSNPLTRPMFRAESQGWVETWLRRGLFREGSPSPLVVQGFTMGDVHVLVWWWRLCPCTGTLNSSVSRINGLLCVLNLSKAASGELVPK